MTRGACVIGRSGRARLALLAVAALSSTGLTACASAPQQLACSAQPSSLTPAANTTETITINTAAGAKVLTQAAFATPNPFRTTTADGTGVARVSYPVGTSAAGHPVKVTVAAAKNGANGSCSTTFTPKPRPTLHAAFISVKWVLPPLPHGSGACAAGHTSDCGRVTTSVLVSGFSQFGGTPTCANSDVNTCRNFAGAVLSGQLSLAWTISCPTTGLTVTRNDVPVRLVPEPGAFNYKVTPVTRVNADSARVEIAADLPFGDDVAGCSQTPSLLSLNATNVAFRLIGGGYPTAYFSAVGPFAPQTLPH
jgi:hypothetical protein